MKIYFDVGTKHYAIEASTAGCDIFINGKYLTTLQDDKQIQPETYWIGKGVEEVINRITKSV